MSDEKPTREQSVSKGRITAEWLTTVFGQTLKVAPAQLLLTAESQARMKELAQLHEVSFFPETAWQANQHQRVIVDELIDGRLRVVNSDDNLLRLMRWTHPMGLNVPKVPVWFMTAKTKPQNRLANS